MVLQPVAEGMLGLRPNASGNALTMKPALPWHWEYYDLKNIRVGEHTLHIRMDRSDTEIDYTLDHSGSPPLNLELQPVLAFGAEVSSVALNGKELSFQTLPKKGGISLNIEAFDMQEKASLKVTFKGGGSYLPQEFDPQPEDATKKFRILAERRSPDWEIDLEGEYGQTETLKVYSLDAPKGVEGGIIKENNHPFYVLEVPMDGVNEGKYNYKTLKLHHER